MSKSVQRERETTTHKTKKESKKAANQGKREKQQKKRFARLFDKRKGNRKGERKGETHNKPQTRLTIHAHKSPTINANQPSRTIPHTTKESAFKPPKNAKQGVFWDYYRRAGATRGQKAGRKARNTPKESNGSPCTLHHLHPVDTTTATNGEPQRKPATLKT